MGAATKVAAGILLSRIAGFVRDASLAYYFGAGPHADVFRTVLRGPNILQNLLGEQTLSASFIPVYSRLSDEDPQRAGRLAGAVFTLLLVAVSVLVVAGVLLAEPLVALLAPGFAVSPAAGAGTDRFALAVRAVRWIFPMTGVLVLSAWALGVLNSHRRFFVAYVAPVAWNAAIVTSLIVGGRALAGLAAGEPAALDRLLLTACAGALVGAVLQLLVQLPAVAAVLRGFRLRLSTRVAGVRETLRAFGPLVAARGVVQISAWVDLVLASFLTVGAIGAIGWAYTLYILPISLFAMSVAAAELPELARRTTSREEAFVERLEGALERVGILIVPTVIGYLALGYLIVAAIYRRGSFGAADNALVHAVLAAYSLGLLATTASRLLANAFYALGETRVPARIAVARVTISALAGAGLMLWLDRWTVAVLPWQGGGSELRLGAVGLAAGSALGAWIELVLLRRGLVERRPRARRRLRLAGGRLPLLVATALAVLVPALGLWWLLREQVVLLQGLLVVGCYAGCYLGALALGGTIRPRRLLSEVWPSPAAGDDIGEEEP